MWRKRERGRAERPDRERDRVREGELCSMFSLMRVRVMEVRLMMHIKNNASGKSSVFSFKNLLIFPQTSCN